MKYCVTINNKRYEIEVEKGEAEIVSTTEIVAEIMQQQNQVNSQAAVAAAAAMTPKVIESLEKGADQSPAADAAVSVVSQVSATTPASAPALITGKEVVKAPMAGGIMDIKVSKGSIVAAGDTLLVLEAMKMENEITAHVDGVVAEILVEKGAVVATDAVMLIIR